MDWMTMPSESTPNEKCHRILEQKGGKIADKAKTILLDEISVEGLQQPLQYVSEIWRDPLAPAFIVLSCKAVGGRPSEATHQASIAMSLMNLSLKLWDDIVDKTRHIGFVPTLLGKSGDEVSLIAGGLVSAKAFLVLAEIKIARSRHQIINRLVWDYWRTMARAEMVNLELRKRDDVRPEEKLRVYEMEAIHLETLMKIGAVLGNGSKEEIRHLGSYGRCLGEILELEKDIKVSLNLTLELSQKVKRNALPYSLLWARTRSDRIDENLQRYRNGVGSPNVKQLVEAVLETGAVENAISLIEQLIAKARGETAKLRKTKSSNLLSFFAGAQHRIVKEILCDLLD